jgi:hypothetical protein
MPGRKWEINWYDESGEAWSEECVDDAELLDRIRELLADGSP